MIPLLKQYEYLKEIRKNLQDYRIDNDETILESYPLEEVARRGELMAYRHEAFWYCMDTVRDKDELELMWREERAPWKY